ncbi:unnamed protein product [Phaedon cochleariae]|uniref:Uncharacterized protein n=1 Tax=Phaedon cochleariae TaxID=80249 RepID=A0A9N9SCN7_PHACE|nr:unnamed protein product [Phaedon cochleariae]
MYSHTFGINEWMMKHWVNSGVNNDLKDSRDLNVPTRQRLSNEMKQKMELMKEFSKDLPKLESHYCRASTSKLYLEPLFQTKMDVYRLHKEHCIQNNMTALCAISFKQEMKKLNIGIHRPKKDQCDLCIGHKTRNISNEIYDNHIRRKDQARRQNQEDKDLACTRKDDDGLWMFRR